MTTLVKDAKLENCACCDRDDGVAGYDDDEQAATWAAVEAAEPAWVDWHEFFANATGPGARAATDANRARKSSGVSTSDVFGILIDAAADAGAALAGPDALVVNSTFDLLADRDRGGLGVDDDGDQGSAAAASDAADNATFVDALYVVAASNDDGDCLDASTLLGEPCVGGGDQRFLERPASAYVVRRTDWGNGSVVTVDGRLLVFAPNATAEALRVDPRDALSPFLLASAAHEHGAGKG